MPRGFALGPHFETFIDAQVKGGRLKDKYLKMAKDRGL